VRRAKALHPAAFLIDQNRGVPSDQVAELAGQPP
jgi:hypothetical protein